MLGLLAVGLGQSGRHWVTGMLPQVPEIALAGCVDVDPAALHLAVDEAAVAEERCFTSLDDALSATDPDAVLIATTLPGHVPVARAALQAGLHVLVEKPFAPTLAEAGRARRPGRASRPRPDGQPELSFLPSRQGSR